MSKILKVGIGLAVIASTLIASDAGSRPTRRTIRPPARQPAAEERIQGATASPILTQITTAALRVQRSSDQFATMPAMPEAEGQPVGVHVRPTVVYRDGVLTLSTRTGTAHASGDRRPVMIVFWSNIGGPTGTHPEMNAYGATGSVVDVESTELGVAVGGASWEGLELTYSTQMEAEAARALSQNVELVIEGTLSSTVAGRLASCELQLSTPTISFPVSDNRVSCWVGIQATRVALVDTRDGATLHEWRVMPQQFDLACDASGQLLVTSVDLARDRAFIRAGPEGARVIHRITRRLDTITIENPVGIVNFDLSNSTYSLDDRHGYLAQGTCTRQAYTPIPENAPIAPPDTERKRD